MTVADRPAPLMELGMAMAMLQRRDGNPVFSPWRRRLARSLPRLAHPILQLVSPLGAGPMFMDPPSDDVEEGMDQILSTPRPQARAELRRMCAIDRLITPWVRGLADRDRDAWQVLKLAVHASHASVIAEAWPRIQAGFHAETAWRSRILAQQGLHAALTGLAPSIRWRGMTLEAPFPRDLDLTLHGHGIILQPALFWADHLLTAPHPDGRLLLIYPAVTPLPLRDASTPADSLAALVGSTRAQALRLLVRQHTTTDLARELAVSPAAASMQAKILREAGLIVSQRDGKAMWHWCTPLGLDLLAHGRA
ncbi:ArsR/SmtB family transcription factor [Streptomyces sparsogenes]|uniref:ArsR family transcriptional regulator n=1 Tax=Streptomyces sparsogenes DSM 40356 TaxID=1331668 RepID=A0A1R1S415_9ACTN|nr:winged helix-turn-helix domain-containing protein [Streptomyces sparsogenes]OMI33031.1 ArsR family transcriptional regulator [Streptomyces sparsogenes DSM 40356]